MRDTRALSYSPVRKYNLIYAELYWRARFVPDIPDA